MKDNPKWVDVTELMQTGVGNFIAAFVKSDPANLSTYINRLTLLDGIKTINMHIEEITGEDKTNGVVVEIFNRVNSGGTKLSGGDLALAKICSSWPQARAEMKQRLTKWKTAGFDFRMEWLLRVINAIVTGSASSLLLKVGGGAI